MAYNRYQAGIRVDFYADHCAFDPLWSTTGRYLSGSLMSADGFPLSRELRTDLRAWQRWFDELQGGLGPVPLPSDFHTEGRHLLAELRRELEPTWPIVSSWYDDTVDGVPRVLLAD